MMAPLQSHLAKELVTRLPAQPPVARQQSQSSTTLEETMAILVAFKKMMVPLPGQKQAAL